MRCTSKCSCLRSRRWRHWSRFPDDVWKVKEWVSSPLGQGSLRHFRRDRAGGVGFGGHRDLPKKVACGVLQLLHPGSGGGGFMNRTTRVMLFVLCGQLLLAGCMASSGAPIDRQVSVGTHALHLYCQGKPKGGWAGSPAVVIETGSGETYASWLPLMGELARETRVCAYDRAGYGRSEPGPLPRGAGREADELRLLLQKAGVEGPYVLVGHSLGGLNAQVFASKYPDLLAGAVLLDPTPLGWLTGDAFPELRAHVHPAGGQLQFPGRSHAPLSRSEGEGDSGFLRHDGFRDVGDAEGDRRTTRSDQVLRRHAPRSSSRPRSPTRASAMRHRPFGNTGTSNPSNWRRNPHRAFSFGPRAAATTSISTHPSSSWTPCARWSWNRGRHPDTASHAGRPAANIIHLSNPRTPQVADARRGRWWETIRRTQTGACAQRLD